MKRYTLLFEPNGLSISTEQLKEEVEQVLLRLHPRITYRMGQVYQGADGRLLAEFAADGKRAMLDQAFESRSWKLPVQLESISWGWTTENEEAMQLTSSTASVEADPLAKVQPISGSAQIQLSKRRLWRRYLIFIVLTFLVLLLVVANIFNAHSPALEWIYIAVFTIWLFSLNEIPFDFRLYAHAITIDQDGIRVEYWWRHRSRQVDWSTIWGLNYANPIAEVSTSGGKVRFLLSERFGCSEKPVILKTIVMKADLRYVEGNFLKLTYLQPDAKVIS